MNAIKKGKKTKTSLKPAVVTAIAMLMTFCSFFSACTGNSDNFSKDNDLSSSGKTTASNENEAVSVEGFSSVQNVNTHYSVSTSSDLATEVGMEVLANGGNAVDAAVAAAYTLAVVEPYASGLGGSGCMLVYDQRTGRCRSYDYRAAAGENVREGDRSGVPGFVAGMSAVLDDWGTFDLAKLIEPAVNYAENGLRINNFLSKRINEFSSDLSAYSQFYNDKGEFVSEGDILKQTELAVVLRDICGNGPDSFYNGKTAKDICNTVNLTQSDFSGYSVIEREALCSDYCGYTVYSAGGPMSGVTLIQMLKASELLEMPDPEADLTGYLKVLKDITLHSFEDRRAYLTDFDNMEIDEQFLLTNDHILEMMNGYVNPDAFWEDESVETTSISVVDGNGLVVTATNTLSHFWGSRVCVDGIFLNNTNRNFTNGINSIGPGKRSRTFTAPTILLKEDGTAIATGTPGGNNIPAILFGVIQSICKYDTEPQAAVDRLRILYRNNILTIEIDEDLHSWINTESIYEKIVTKKGDYWWGGVSLAGISENGAFGAFDKRRGATMVGVFNQ